MVDRRLWDDDGAELLAAAYAFHAGVSRQAAVQVRAMEEPSAVTAGGQHQPPAVPVPPGGQGGRYADASYAYGDSPERVA